jgi:preprotein translocase subunit SecE
VLGVQIPPGLPFLGSGDLCIAGQKDIDVPIYLEAMKKKKPYKKKANTRSSHEASSVKAVQGKDTGRGEVTEGKKPSQTPLKKEVSKKTENNVFVLKRYIMIARQFLSDAKVELKKVTWPTRKELLSTTAIVIVLVLIISFFLGIVDFGLVKIIKNIIR